MKEALDKQQIANQIYISVQLLSRVQLFVTPQTSPLGNSVHGII